MNPSILILLIVFGTSISLAHKTPEKNEATNPLDLDQSRLTSRKFFKDHNEEIVCYSPYGCFTKNEVDNKFTIGKILARFPEDPRKLGVQYYFFSCKDYFNPTVLPWTLNESDLIRNLNYNPKFQTIILVHGYTERFNQLDWTGDLKDTVLNRDSCRWNVIGVEYGRAVQSPYAQAIANAKLVGAMIAYLIRQLNLAFNTTNNDFVLVGHSLGCHTAGFAGKKLTDPKLRMILASEPAGPAFNRVSNSERLSPTDADLVLTVQTNQGSSFLQGSGVKDPLGHYSFLVNDASAQPGCQVINRMGNLFTDGLINGLYAIGGCSHARSIELIIAYAYEDSRNDFQVMAYRCPRYQDYDEGRCSRCDSSLDCVRFGHWFEYWLERKKPPVNSNATRIYRMNTRKSMPYSLHAYGFEIQTGRNFIPFRGSLRLSMTGSLRNDHIAHFDWLGNFKPRKTYTALFTYRKTLGKILTINATLTSGGNLKLPAIASKIKVRKIIVRYMNGFEKSFREQYSSILYPLKHKSTIEGRHKQTMFLSEDSDPKSQPNGREPLEPFTQFLLSNSKPN